ncbi:hypothetical protein [Cetobacterium sp.]|uniref:hypothetical protein n=1 Tax=Cetobacterium sp. TaxID=2071632 RepID=UPI003EE6FE73
MDKNEKILDCKDYIPPKFDEVCDFSQQRVIAEDIKGTKFYIQFAIPNTNELIEFDRKCKYINEKDGYVRIDFEEGFRFIMERETTIPKINDLNILTKGSVVELVNTFCK